MTGQKTVEQDFSPVAWVDFRRGGLGALALGLALALAGCNGEQAAGAPDGAVRLVGGDVCVEVPEGYYVYADGQFTPVTFPPGSVDAEVVTISDDALARRIAAGFGGLGFGWMSLGIDGRSATLSGTAPDADARLRAFRAGEAAIRNDPDAGRVEVIVDNIRVGGGEARIRGGEVASRIAAGFPALGFDWMGLVVNGEVATLTGTAPDEQARTSAFQAGRSAILEDAAGSSFAVIANGIEVAGAGASVGSALSMLDANPSLEACQNAFTRTMEGRFIEFSVGRAAIDDRSAGLLDALSGVAIICSRTEGLVIEIGGHTDSRGSEADNQALSQRRAEEVRDYLIGKGVSASALRAVGYGESRLLDRANTLEAHGRNRRTEFTLSQE